MPLPISLHQAVRLPLLVVLLPIAILLGQTIVDYSILIGSLLLVIIVELLNSAVEAVVDRVGDEHHELAGRAKDIGSAAVFVSLLIIAIQFASGQTSGIWIVVMLCVYMASLAISINAVIWVLIGEIFPTRIRGRAMSIATFANWGINFLTAFLFPWYVAKIGMSAGFFTFAALCLIATIFFYKYVPETRGKSLEEIGQSETGCFVVEDNAAVKIQILEYLLGIA